MIERCVALLGRPDTPTDAVEDYCRYLGAALEKHGVSLELMRVPWPEVGWHKALREVRNRAEELKGSWFLVQYTALAWSRRGFPLRLPKLIRLLKNCGARYAVVFHDATPYGGSRVIDRLRRALQGYVMRRTLRMADLAVLTIPREKVSWIPSGSRNIVFIPVGANLPAPGRAWTVEKNIVGGIPTVCVFSLSRDSAGREEVETIALAIRYAAQEMGSMRLVVAGRNSDEAAQGLREKLGDARIELIVYGLLPGDELVRVLGACSAMLFAKGNISCRRGSALAGIACGLPIIALQGSETAAPITEAGVVLLPHGARNEFGPALVRVLTDEGYRESLAEQSRRAQERYFSWSAIAAQYLHFLNEAPRARIQTSRRAQESSE